MEPVAILPETAATNAEVASWTGARDGALDVDVVAGVVEEGAHADAVRRLMLVATETTVLARRGRLDSEASRPTASELSACTDFLAILFFAVRESGRWPRRRVEATTNRRSRGCSRHQRRHLQWTVRLVSRQGMSSSTQ